MLTDEVKEQIDLQSQINFHIEEADKLKDKLWRLNRKDHEESMLDLVGKCFVEHEIDGVDAFVYVYGIYNEHLMKVISFWKGEQDKYPSTISDTILHYDEIVSDYEEMDSELFFTYFSKGMESIKSKVHGNTKEI